MPSSFGRDRPPVGLLWIHCVGRYLFMLLLLIQLVVTALAAESVHGATTGEAGLIEVHQEEEEYHLKPVHAVYFPAFILTLGVVVFFLLSRFAPALPYTAVMFFIGTLMGSAATLVEEEGHVQDSLDMWIRIDSEVLLLVFLPGLIYKDSVGLNPHLFWIALPQLLIFAFPLVLVGTVLTALIGFYIFPHDWSFNLAMTFGSILSATDPVAVAVLLEEVGAPPRLKVHVAGESLLNDGSAIVFYAIFSKMFFYEIGLEEGAEVGWVAGIGLFCRKALGGVAIGLAFGLILLLLLFTLNRRFNREENVVEVVATLAIAYMGFYVAEIVCSTSGVMSTVATGLMVKFFGSGLISDPKLMEDFWTLVEHILNAVLFTLGGVVWGAVVTRDSENAAFTRKDWGYLILLYVLLTLMRALMFVAVFPVINRIGLKSSWQEAVFQVHGGLRGAVGIALSVALDNLVARSDAPEEVKANTSRIFVYVGGIAFITLVFNGLTAGPLLRKLGLADTTETREKIVSCYSIRYRQHIIDEFIRLLTYKRFNQVNFGFVKLHVPQLATLTRAQLLEAVDRHKDSTPDDEYSCPRLKHVLQYLPEENPADKVYDFRRGVDDQDQETAADRISRMEQRHRERKKARQKRSSSTMHFLLEGEPLSAQEFRAVFVSMLRSAYHKQVKEGELMSHHFLTIALVQSLEFTEAAVAEGEPLRDWDFVTMMDRPISGLALKLKNQAGALGCLKSTWAKRASRGWKVTAARVQIDRSLSFIAAHKWAQGIFIKEFRGTDSELSEAAKIVLEESREQVAKAEAVLSILDPGEVELAVSQKFCTIILVSAIFYADNLVEVGLLKETEAEHMVEQVQEHLDEIYSSNEVKLPAEFSLKHSHQEEEPSTERSP